jgi:hypothetical protein
MQTLSDAWPRGSAPLPLARRKQNHLNPHSRWIQLTASLRMGHQTTNLMQTFFEQKLEDTSFEQNAYGAAQWPTKLGVDQSIFLLSLIL